MSKNHLKIKHLSLDYGKEWSLKSINLTLQQGELVGLLGPSGCGKTTLLRLIAGFERPAKGSIYINDIQVASSTKVLPPERRGVGMVFQNYALFPHLDVWRNVCFGLRRGQNSKRATWLLELLGLSDLSNRYPHELSGGQQQRLALARALAPGSSLVLLDEPFCSLDVDVRMRLRSELSSVLQTCGATGILVTHDPQEALAICDRVAVMKEGALQQIASPNDLVNQPATPFVGRFVLQRNVLPIEPDGEKFITPIGPISKTYSASGLKDMELMFDEEALTLDKNPLGEARVQSREFLGNYWLLKVELGKYILRIRHPLEKPVNIGDRCKVKFKPDQKGILFPGTISCKLA